MLPDLAVARAEECSAVVKCSFERGAASSSGRSAASNVAVLKLATRRTLLFRGGRH
jgi:hypothetical protein